MVITSKELMKMDNKHNYLKSYLGKLGQGVIYTGVIISSILPSNVAGALPCDDVIFGDLSIDCEVGKPDAKIAYSVVYGNAELTEEQKRRCFDGESVQQNLLNFIEIKAEEEMYKNGGKGPIPGDVNDNGGKDYGDEELMFACLNHNKSCGDIFYLNAGADRKLDREDTVPVTAYINQNKLPTELGDLFGADRRVTITDYNAGYQELYGVPLGTDKIWYSNTISGKEVTQKDLDYIACKLNLPQCPKEDSLPTLNPILQLLLK